MSKLLLPFGIGSCQIKSSLGASGPKYLVLGPISRCKSLNQALAKFSDKLLGFL